MERGVAVAIGERLIAEVGLAGDGEGACLGVVGKGVVDGSGRDVEDDKVLAGGVAGRLIRLEGAGVGENFVVGGVEVLKVAVEESRLRRSGWCSWG